MSQEDMVQAFVALGYSLNEGRAYSVLLQSGPCTGYEVSLRSKVPRSAVYNALRRLVASGAARSVAGTPERFVAAPSETIIHLLRQRFEAAANRLENAIQSLEVGENVPDAFSVYGYSRVIEEAKRLIDQAEQRILISAWPREVLLFQQSLEKAVGLRKVRAFIFSHALPPQNVPGIFFSYGLEESALEAFWKHRLVIVIDDRYTLIGSTENITSDSAVISETRAIADLAVNQITLDITLLAQRYEQDIGGLMSEMLGSRVGGLDELLANNPVPLIGHQVRAPRRKRTSKKNHADISENGKDTNGESATSKNIE